MEKMLLGSITIIGDGESLRQHGTAANGWERDYGVNAAQWETAHKIGFPTRLIAWFDRFEKS